MAKLLAFLGVCLVVVLLEGCPADSSHQINVIVSFSEYPTKIVLNTLSTTPVLKVQSIPEEFVSSTSISGRLVDSVTGSGCTAGIFYGGETTVLNIRFTGNSNSVYELYPTQAGCTHTVTFVADSGEDDNVTVESPAVIRVVSANVSPSIVNNSGVATSGVIAGEKIGTKFTYDSGTASNAQIFTVASSGSGLVYTFDSGSSCSISSGESNCTVMGTVGANSTSGSYQFIYTSGDDNDTALTATNGSFTVSTSSGSSSPWPQISAGYRHTCALNANGKAYCWGYNSSGRLGDGTTTNSDVPVAVVNGSEGFTNSGVLNITAGNNHTCAIDADGAAYCWGYNGQGQLGDSGANFTSSTPVAVVNTSGFSSITAGNGFTCALKSSNGKTYCWGANSVGQLGINSTIDASTPQAVLSSGSFTNLDAKAVSAGDQFACAVDSSDKAYCWGYNSNGQLGDGTTAQSLTAVAVATSGDFTNANVSAISAAANHACVIAGTNDKVYCWGDNTDGQLGNDSTTQSTTPVLVASSGDFTNSGVLAVAAGYGFTCAIDANNQAYCWGDNTAGALGNGSSAAKSLTAVAVATSGDFTNANISAITAGGANDAYPQPFACALNTDNNAYCWGDNADGQLGNATSGSFSRIPVKVTDFSS